MTNRERLIKTNIYDLLVRMHVANMAHGCILTLVDPFTVSDNPDDWCDPSKKTIMECKQCIQNWLNEEE